MKARILLPVVGLVFVFSSPASALTQVTQDACLAGAASLLGKADWIDGTPNGPGSGAPYNVIPAEHGYVTPLPYGTDTDWCLNVLAAGECTLTTTGREATLTNPRIVDPDAALPLLPALLRPALRLLDLPGYLLLDRG
jgi:hypothetical protein